MTRLSRRPVRGDDFLADVLAGLLRPRKRLPCKYLYDRRGSELFERICDLEEYYLTRLEIAILREHGAAMAGRLGAGCVLIELGSGSARKTPLLLGRLERPAAYAPIDISREQLRESARRMGERFGGLRIVPVHADFARPLRLELPRGARRAVFFPGSTIGNWDPPAAARLLARVGRIAGPGGAHVLGIDLKKPREVLEAAYNDGQGVTAEFNLNLLARINRELGADLDIGGFEHRAFYDPERGRVEMHLVSRRAQSAAVAGRRIDFRAGESIHTESSYKYSPEEAGRLAAAGGWRVEEAWMDARRWFAVMYMERAGWRRD